MLKENGCYTRLYLKAKSICECESYSTDLMNMSANSVASGVPTGENTNAVDSLAVETMMMVPLLESGCIYLLPSIFSR